MLLRWPGVELTGITTFAEDTGRRAGHVRYVFGLEGRNDMNYNIQVDVKSARHVIENSHPTLIPLSVTVETSLRRIFLDDLGTSGALGQLIARQAEAFAVEEQYETTNYGSIEYPTVVEIPTRKLRDQDNIEMNWRIHQQWNEDRLTPFSAKFER